MRVSRIYFQELENNQNNIITISNELEQYNYITKVLRLKKNYTVKLFNNTGYDYICEIIEISNKKIELNINNKIKVNTESDLKIHLAQGISKPNHFEITLQKSVELGISEITPIISERAETLQFNDKKIDRYEKIIISACEQSNRAIIPKLNEAIHYSEFLQQDFIKNEDNLCLIPDPASNNKIDINTIKNKKDCTILIGPEGGFSDSEIELAVQYGFIAITLGPRILRTETAGIALISFLQFLSLS